MYFFCGISNFKTVLIFLKLNPHSPYSTFKQTYNLHNKYTFLQLFESSKSSSLLSSPIDFSDLFYPNIFLNALRQTTSRQIKIPLDQLILSSAWTPSQLPAKQCVQVQGLLLQGATFDSFLRETTVSSAAYSQAPIVFLAWTSESSSTITGEQIQVPVYSSSERSDLICSVNMPCRGADQWNIAAVALFLR